MLDEMTKSNAQNLVVFLEYENLGSFSFPFVLSPGQL